MLDGNRDLRDSLITITYDIVTQQHGGNITVDNEVGEYSEFTMRLPRNP